MHLQLKHDAPGSSVGYIGIALLGQQQLGYGHARGIHSNGLHPCKPAQVRGIQQRGLRQARVRHMPQGERPASRSMHRNMYLL
jgi:hypothetical protein